MQLVLILINEDFVLTGIYWRTKTQFVGFMSSEPEQCRQWVMLHFSKCRNIVTRCVKLFIS
jgi:hypothetical protein